MIKGILVGIDGSPFSELAIELGLKWGKRFGLLLAGQAVIDRTTLCRAEAVPIGAGYFKRERDEVLLTEAHRKANRFLKEFAIRCADEHLACKVLEDEGKPSEMIELAAQGFDLVLLGKETRFTLDTQMNPDDTLVRLLRDGSRPVVSVPLSVRDSGPIVVAYDGSGQSARALQSFEATGLADGSEIYVVSVAPKRILAARQTDRAVQFLALHNHRAQAVPLESSYRPALTILNEIDKRKAQMLVMGAYGENKLREFFLGSVTRELLKHATVPIFMQH